MKKLLLLAIAVLGTGFAQAQNNPNYTIISQVSAGNAVTAWLYITAPPIQKSYVIEFGQGIRIEDAVYDQGDLVRVQWIDNEIQYHKLVSSGVKSNPLVHARWDRTMQKNIKKLEKELANN